MSRFTSEQIQAAAKKAMTQKSAAGDAVVPVASEPMLLYPSELPSHPGLWFDEGGRYYRLAVASVASELCNHKWSGSGLDAVCALCGARKGGPVASEPPQAPCHYNHGEACAWQSGWESGRVAPSYDERVFSQKHAPTPTSEWNDGAKMENAIKRLEIALAAVENNAPIHEAEGKTEQAQYERECAESYRAAIAVLKR